MREGYTYDDEMPSAQGSYMNRNNRRRNFPKLTGRCVGHLVVDPITKEISMIPLTDEEQAAEDKKWEDKNNNRK